MKRLFVTGISTEVGKTIASAILAEALQADYWKPVQAGDLDYSDSDKVAALISNDTSVIHKNSYALNTPMSPHAAAEIDKITIDLDKIVEPDTRNHLVIEGAGGLLVPLNDHATIADLIRPNYQVIVVSRHYLGSINHTLLTLEALKNRGIKSHLIFSGPAHPTTEQIILNKTSTPCIGRIGEESEFTKETVKKYAEEFSAKLLEL
ncbi:MAG: dethiobiotin synthase [Eudoraea sp.]|nr:dethiobiotin synthase [Eudoraea sp.]